MNSNLKNNLVLIAVVLITGVALTYLFTSMVGTIKQKN